MRFLHIADLHIGKVLHKHSLLADQKQVLQQIVCIAETEKADAVLIAGDIYQRNTPSPEAMTVFSDFLAALSQKQIPVYIISGNHDSAARVSYLSEIAEAAGIHIAGTEPGKVYQYLLHDAYGDLTLHLLPHCTPLQIRSAFPAHAEEIRTYEDAVRFVLALNPPQGDGRHVLVCHQFLTGAQTCESEELAIGGMDNIPASVFDAYDYVALGHLHGAQQVSRPTVRYAGSPLRYSFSEITQKKSVTLAEIREKGDIEITAIPLEQPHGMQELTGDLETLLQHPRTDDYVRIVLTDEEPPADAARRLRGVFPNLLQMTVQNSKTRADRVVDAEENGAGEQLDMLALLREFYAFQNAGAEPSAAQTDIAKAIFEKMDREVGAS